MSSSAGASRRAAPRTPLTDLLDPTDLMPNRTTADIYSLRHLILHSGIPDSPRWVRAQAWKVLLGYLPTEKKEWSATLDKRRQEYYRFVSDFGNVANDDLLDQIYKDLKRSRKNGFAFYSAQVPPSSDCPLAPEPADQQAEEQVVERLKERHHLLLRLASINADFARQLAEEGSLPLDLKGKARETLHESSPPPPARHASPEMPMSPPIYLSPPSPGGASADSFTSAQEGGVTDSAPPAVPSKEPEPVVDRNWHSLLRILYIHALLNPSIGYVQGMNEALFTLFYAFGTEPHAEADAFWCFSILLGEVRELYEFDGIDFSISPLSSEGNFSKTGMAGALKRLSLRLKWLDSELWQALRAANLDPRMPYYSFRWLACLTSTELSLPNVLRVWDALLAEQETSMGGQPAKIEFLIDICCALLIHIKPQLLGSGEEAFAQGMKVLQSYPDDDVGPILESAALFRQRRLAADLTGDAPPEEDEEEEETVGVRARATQALRGWSASPASVNLTPAKGGWFGSIGRSSATPGDSPDTSLSFASATSTPSRPSVGGVFQRYATAIQSSDAAANLSKASTNLTAKALASFGPSDSSISPEHTRMTSFGSSFFKKDSTASTSSSPRTPEMARWSRDTMPDFPLPDVSDSPAGRMEYTDSRGKRISMAPLGRNSPTPSEDSFSLPSLRAAAKLGLMPRQKESPRSVGPKPLLLRQSARPPREGSNSGLDEPSRKVSSGPLATSRSGSRGTSQNGGSSISGRSSSASDSDSPNTSLTTETFAATEGGRPLGLQGKEGTVPAGAFRKEPKMEFGAVASSSDVPLVNTRPRMARSSVSTIGSKSSKSFSGSFDEKPWKPVELQDEPVVVSPESRPGSIVRAKRLTKTRSGRQRPVSNESDLLRDDMFAAPTSDAPNLDGGLAAIGASLAFPQNDDEDASRDNFI